MSGSAKRRVLVAGATGRLGRELVSELKSRGYFVRAIGRDIARLRAVCPRADELCECDVLRVKNLQPLLAGIDSVVSSLGASVIPTFRDGRRSFTSVDTPANLRLVQAAEAAGVQRSLYVSVFATECLAKNDFVLGHERVVAALRASGMDHAIVRPTGFFSSLVEIMRGPSWVCFPKPVAAGLERIQFMRRTWPRFVRKRLPISGVEKSTTLVGPRC